MFHKFGLVASVALTAFVVTPGIAFAGESSEGLKSSNWSGCYAGLDAGFSFSGRSKKENVLPYANAPFPAPAFLGPTNDVTDETDISGGTGGAEAGCNFQYAQVVFGPDVEGWYQDASGRAITSLAPVDPGEYLNERVMSDYGLAAAARLGYVFDDTLFYGKAGIALSSFHYKGGITDAVGRPLDLVVTGNHLSTGLLLGGGVEHSINQRWSIEAEYEFVDFGRAKRSYEAIADYQSPAPYFWTGGSATTSEILQYLKVGINYRF